MDMTLEQLVYDLDETSYPDKVRRIQEWMTNDDVDEKQISTYIHKFSGKSSCCGADMTFKSMITNNYQRDQLICNECFKVCTPQQEGHDERM